MRTQISLALAFILVFTIAKSQTIPNSGFEDWTSMGTYNNPNSWSTLNDMTAAAGTFTCVKGTPGVAGSSYVKLVSQSVPGIGIASGIAVCGTVDWITLQPTSGFPFSGRPQSLNGQWQYMASGADQGFIGVALTQWNNTTMIRDTVAFAYSPLTGMSMMWANFSIPLTYLTGGDPDSCIIALSASCANGTAAAANSYLYVDDLSFAGVVAGINEIGMSAITISPNPASDVLAVDLSSINEKVTSIEIFNIEGRLMKSENPVSSKNITIVIDDLPKGNYVLKISTSTGRTTRNFVKQ